MKRRRLGDGPSLALCAFFLQPSFQISDGFETGRSYVVHDSLRTRRLALFSSAVLVLCVLPASAQGCPELLGLWPYGPASVVAVSGTTAYVGSGPALLVVDVSVPASPQLLGEVTLPEVVSGLAVVGNLALVVDYANLRVIDVSVPSAPVEVGIVDTLPAANGVAVAGSYAYVTAGNSGLRVISIANPSAPVEVGSVQPSGVCNSRRGGGGKLRIRRLRGRWVAGDLDRQPSAPVTLLRKPRTGRSASRWWVATPTLRTSTLGCG